MTPTRSLHAGARLLVPSNASLLWSREAAGLSFSGERHERVVGWGEELVSIPKVALLRPAGRRGKRERRNQRSNILCQEEVHPIEPFQCGYGHGRKILICTSIRTRPTQNEPVHWFLFGGAMGAMVEESVCPSPLHQQYNNSIKNSIISTTTTTTTTITITTTTTITYAMWPLLWSLRSILKHQTTGSTTTLVPDAEWVKHRPQQILLWSPPSCMSCMSWRDLVPMQPRLPFAPNVPTHG